MNTVLFSTNICRRRELIWCRWFFEATSEWRWWKSERLLTGRWNFDSSASPDSSREWNCWSDCNTHKWGNFDKYKYSGKDSVVKIHSCSVEWIWREISESFFAMFLIGFTTVSSLCEGNDMCKRLKVHNLLLKAGSGSDSFLLLPVDTFKDWDDWAFRLSSSYWFRRRLNASVIPVISLCYRIWGFNNAVYAWGSVLI